MRVLYGFRQYRFDKGAKMLVPFGFRVSGLRGSTRVLEGGYQDFNCSGASGLKVRASGDLSLGCRDNLQWTLENLPF